MKSVFLYILAAAMLSTCGNASGKTAGAAETAVAVEVEPQVALEWDKTVHDFGDVSVADGPLTCTFTLKNVGNEALTIFEVVSSCGCTNVEFTRDKIEPGQSATISATYKNEDGPNAFDKTLTVYISGIRRPVILRLRGVVHKESKSLSQLYSPEKLGDFGLKTRKYRTGTLKQGLSVSETATVANLGTKPLKVAFTDVSPELSLNVTPNPIPAGTTATLSYTVNANRELYGLNVYSAIPVLNGAKAAQPLEFAAWTQENFALWSKDEIANGSAPSFFQSTVSFDTVKQGIKLPVEFSCTNSGKSPFHIYKADADSPALTPVSLPDVPSGKKGSISFLLDTSLLPEGDNVIMISLTTNSPQRPLINLFVAGEVIPRGAK